ncbi:hypothetical protein SS05631_c27900 [Sinorhizobium sp. CCBAU 05631]|nr:hypothetical protein SS05631_c27900 [Sinorhizobium sp. CCBAU 05631]
MQAQSAEFIHAGSGLPSGLRIARGSTAERTVSRSCDADDHRQLPGALLRLGPCRS